MEYEEEHRYEDAPRSDSNVSLRLADIQRRCAELLNDPDSELELSLEEPAEEADPRDYYQRD